jgi:hypothetical protein
MCSKRVQKRVEHAKNQGKRLTTEQDMSSAKQRVKVVFIYRN